MRLAAYSDRTLRNDEEVKACDILLPELAMIAPLTVVRMAKRTLNGR